MKTIGIFFTCFIWVMGMHAQPQQNFVQKGQVVDHTGTSIPNADVINARDTTEKTKTDKHGLFTLFTKLKATELLVKSKGFATQRVVVPNAGFLAVKLYPAVENPYLMQEVMFDEVRVMEAVSAPASTTHKRHSVRGTGIHREEEFPSYNTESYSPINENAFHRALDEPLSTFSADVDRASYANIRRFIQMGQMPPIDAVRIEEMINYFDYDYPVATGNDPVSIFTELAIAPWNSDHYVMHIGVKARDMEVDKLPPSNLTFLIDVSGSMNAANKLPLLKSAMKMLVQELRDEDHVAIVVYAGAAGLVLESTPGHEKAKIIAAIDHLQAGGSTAGGAGIKLAYDVAAQNFAKNGNNRVIIASDGDFNVGASSDGEMQRLIEEKRQSGVFLTVLGFGMGNYKDSKMEILANKGNGNYAYIDNLTEAKKTLVNEFGSTLFVVAKDVKLQVEFNPEWVESYRLIGYENRLLNKEDFNDDTKDAGEMGVGHVVTALYEIVPVGKGSSAKVDALKYQKQQYVQSGRFSNELATVKMRYKAPDEDQSKLMSSEVQRDVKSFELASNNLKWSSSVAAFGMLLRNSSQKGSATYDHAIEWAEAAVSADKEGYRRECLQLMRSAASMSKSTANR